MTTTHESRPVAEVREADFETEVLRSNQPVLVAFYASWSRPCHVQESALDEVAAACAGRARVVKVNADDTPELSIWYDVQSVPTLLYFVSGGLRARLVGTASKEAIIAKLKELSPSSQASSGRPPRVPDRDWRASPSPHQPHSRESSI